MSDIATDSPTTITAPVIKEPKIGTDTLLTRAPLPHTPENMHDEADKGSITSREPLLHTPASHADVAAEEVLAAAASIPAPVSPVKEAIIVKHPASLIVTPEAFKKAEENLAASLTLSPELTKDNSLVLTLLNTIDHANASVTNLRLSFTGTAVGPNVAELHKELMASLEKNPALAPYFAKHKSHSELVGDQTVLSLDINHLPTDHYAALINALAAPAVTVAKPHADVATDLPPTAPKPDMATNTAEATQEVDAAKKEHSADTVVADVTEAAATTVAGPAHKTIAGPAATEGKVVQLDQNQQLARGA